VLGVREDSRRGASRTVARGTRDTYTIRSTENTIGACARPRALFPINTGLAGSP